MDVRMEFKTLCFMTLAQSRRHLSSENLCFGEKGGARRLSQGSLWLVGAIGAPWRSLVSKESRALFVRDATTKS